MNELFHLVPHGFSLVTFLQHLFFDGIGMVGGYYARGFCQHWWHRWIVGAIFWVSSTLLLVTLVG